MRLLAFLILALIVTSAHAAPSSKPARLGLCATCHGEDGRARIPGAPNLAGQNADYLLNALRDYKTGARNVAAMRAATGPLSESEMQQLARWYASLPACVPTTSAH